MGIIKGEVVRTRRWLIPAYVLTGAAGTPLLYMLCGELWLYETAFAMIILFSVLLLSLKVHAEYSADDERITFVDDSGRSRTVNYKDISGAEFSSRISSVYRDAYHKCLTGMVSFKAGAKHYRFTSKVLAESDLLSHSDEGFKAVEDQLDTKILYNRIMERTK